MKYFNLAFSRRGTLRNRRQHSTNRTATPSVTKSPIGRNEPKTNIAALGTRIIKMRPAWHQQKSIKSLGIARGRMGFVAEIRTAMDQEATGPTASSFACPDSSSILHDAP